MPRYAAKSILVIGKHSHWKDKSSCTEWSATLHRIFYCSSAAWAMSVRHTGSQVFRSATPSHRETHARFCESHHAFLVVELSDDGSTVGCDMEVEDVEVCAFAAHASSARMKRVWTGIALLVTPRADVFKTLRG